ncbi:MAG: hypothetical protein BWX70_03446 [Verrucomicrobia bacterium ADurb.Bin070]|nr:MAG: hypothetical protein BWX70_03446 [Verrucomicrobia bacterium ADurb.Bin070]
MRVMPKMKIARPPSTPITVRMTHIESASITKGRVWRPRSQSATSARTSYRPVASGSVLSDTSATPAASVLTLLFESLPALPGWRASVK